ncbi:PH domain-containing protein [Thioflexithrix psekupsensis]|uniref:YokE-like PH domain-containing protein n=1 Tax=Thioflexithrix psekupsensis TaxID=1570016 RepID=A0A251X7A1_9GAMM|nr:PH domain-containing protein [Thioflexithrix psekupsensis]OUD13341.1 hypothetical protein TPSD3_12020 [Thioflexithrix psekupsensis]
MDENTIQAWLVQGENLEDYITDDGFWKSQTLVVTSQRAILLHSTFFQVSEYSDKYWSQLASVHLTKSFFSATLELKFIKHHNINGETNKPLATPWVLEGITRREAEKMYCLLKAKEREWLQWHYVQCKDANAIGGHCPLSKE